MAYVAAPVREVWSRLMGAQCRAPIAKWPRAALTILGELSCLNRSLCVGPRAYLSREAVGMARAR